MSFSQHRVELVLRILESNHLPIIFYRVAPNTKRDYEVDSCYFIDDHGPIVVVDEVLLHGFLPCNQLALDSSWGFLSLREAPLIYHSV